jgi:hypothetical protein
MAILGVVISVYLIPGHNFHVRLKTKTPPRWAAFLGNKNRIIPE